MHESVIAFIRQWAFHDYSKNNGIALVLVLHDNPFRFFSVNPLNSVAKYVERINNTSS
jgi:hypothetical protein